MYYTCLVLGFQGKYLLEGTERLSYLVGRIGQEIAQARGGKAAFAPHSKLPFRFQEFVRHELPLWLFFALLVAVAVAVFIGYTYFLGNQAEAVSILPNTPAEAAIPVPGAPPSGS